MPGSAFDPSQFGWSKLSQGSTAANLTGLLSSIYGFWQFARGAAPPAGGGGAAVAPVNVIAPSISGSTIDGQTLTTSDGTWTGSPTPTYTYQWQRCNASGLSCVNIGGATANTYTLTAGDIGSTIVAVVTATNTAGVVSQASSASAVVIASGGGGGGGTPASSVTQNGITFNFNKNYPVGQFNNGDYWVIINSGDTAVQITSITPATTGSGATTQSGWYVNPTGNAQSIDGRSGGFNAALLPSFPYNASPGTSVIKGVSLASPVGTGANVTYVDKAVVLTVLSTAPAADAFRPPYFGTYKPIFRQSSLGSLPSLTPVGSPPSLANVENRFQQVQLDHVYITVSGRPLPLQSFHSFTSSTTPHVYGMNITLDNCEAILRVCLNDSLASKQNAINYIVQAGIDWYGIAKSGTRVAANGGGGHQGGRKMMVALAGLLLNDADIKAIAAETTGAGFGETEQFYWSPSAGGASSHFTGRGAGMALFGYTNAFSKPFPYAGSGAKDIRDSSAMVDGGLTTQSPLGAHPATTSATYHGGLYADIAPSNAICAATVCSIVPGIKAIFNYDTEINYADRLWDFGFWTSPDGSPGRSLGSFVTALHGTQPGGASIAAGYGSAFVNAMRTAYYTSTFTGP